MPFGYETRRIGVGRGTGFRPDYVQLARVGTSHARIRGGGPLPGLAPRTNTRIVLPGPTHLDNLADLVAGPIGPNLVTDAHLAALAIEHQAELLSNDTDFGRFPGLAWRNPLTSTSAE